MTANRAASIRARLLNRARHDGIEFNQMLSRYALERWLYRLSVSPDRDRFVLKGALLFVLWFDTPHRPTRDADFLGFMPADTGTLKTSVQKICALESDDGMRFDPETIVIKEIRKEANYDGLRVNLMGWLGTAKCPVQLDVGFGDAVTPEPQEVEYPTLLPDVPAPRLKVYPRETVVAEKLEAMVTLGMKNSRMKDYFNLWVLLRGGDFDSTPLGKAIAATCARRKTILPDDWPVGLSDEFGTDTLKQTQWQAFVRKNALEAPALGTVIKELRTRLEEPLHRARRTGTESFP